MQTPGSVTGNLETHCKEGSQVPEKSPGPPHGSPSVFAQTSQHLQHNNTSRTKRSESSHDTKVGGG